MVNTDTVTSPLTRMVDDISFSQNKDERNELVLFYFQIKGVRGTPGTQGSVVCLPSCVCLFHFNEFYGSALAACNELNTRL